MSSHAQATGKRKKEEILTSLFFLNSNLLETSTSTSTSTANWYQGPGCFVLFLLVFLGRPLVSDLSCQYLSVCGTSRVV
ncbi:hypothetical protein CMV_022646 [Castanea mollissima]|uniref:Uncharacterized protein n=1 Tax=Castanea mollissima TaxID=60419 RepID=A0A8J4QR32_9ROSI|nr:hypothetical protein CMV_022646 [Castanea mollissima]